MGEYAEIELARAMRNGHRGEPAKPSERKPCPFCAQAIGGDHMGMSEHIAARHGMTKAQARKYLVGVAL